MPLWDAAQLGAAVAKGGRFGAEQERLAIGE